MKYYLSRDYKIRKINSAGSKARMDIERILDHLGYCRIGGRNSISKNRLRHFVFTLSNMLRIPGKVGHGDILVLQYPTKYYQIICKLAHLWGAQVVTFVHDLYCFRQKRNSVEKEISLMNMSDAIIGCNKEICTWLLKHGYTGSNGKKVVQPLHVFDFLSESQSPDRKETWPLHQVVYAGQLAPRKNRFLYDLGKYIEGYTVNVYGSGFKVESAAHQEKFDVKGFMHFDSLIRSAEGDFGLVWDGDSVDVCNGNWGEYLMLNTPHKVSLYIRCGLPILIWRKAAMAEFVEENGIGVCIDSLRDIGSVYQRLTRAEYEQMCDQVKRVSKLMSEGFYFNSALAKTIYSLQKQE